MSDEPRRLSCVWCHNLSPDCCQLACGYLGCVTCIRGALAQPASIPCGAFPEPIEDSVASMHITASTIKCPGCGGEHVYQDADGHPIDPSASGQLVVAADASEEVQRFVTSLHKRPQCDAKAEGCEGEAKWRDEILEGGSNYCDPCWEHCHASKSLGRHPKIPIDTHLASGPPPLHTVVLAAVSAAAGYPVLNDGALQPCEVDGHKSKIKEIYCEEDQKYVCSRCQAFLHKHHTCVSHGTRLDRLRLALQTARDVLASVVTSHRDAAPVVVARREEVDHTYDAAHVRVDAVVEELQTWLQSIAASLHSRLRVYQQQAQAHLDSQAAHLSTAAEGLQNTLTTVDAILAVTRFSTDADAATAAGSGAGAVPVDGSAAGAGGDDRPKVEVYQYEALVKMLESALRPFQSTATTAGGVVDESNIVVNVAPCPVPDVVIQEAYAIDDLKTTLTSAMTVVFPPVGGTIVPPTSSAEIEENAVNAELKYLRQRVAELEAENARLAAATTAGETEA